MSNPQDTGTLGKALLASVRDGVWAAPADGSTMLYINPAIERIYGRPADEFHANIDLWQEVVHPDDRELAAQTAPDLFEYGTAQAEYRIVRPDGEVRWILDRKNVVKNENGKLVAIGGIVTDITERRHAELAQRDSDARLQLALDALNGGVWDWNVQTGKVHFSPSWFRMLGYEPGELEGHFETWGKVLHPDDVPRVTRLLEDHFAGKAPYYSEHRMQKKSGEWIWILDRGRVVERDEDGKPLRMTGTEVNVTELRQAKETLAASEARLQDLFDNAPDMFVTVDAETGKITACNRTVARALGWTKDELIGMQIIDVYHPDSRELARENLRSFVEHGTAEAEHLQLQRKDGSPIDVSLRVSASRDEHGQVLYSRSVWRDITELKKFERERKKLDAQVQHAQKLESLGVLAGGIAHDFNNILTAILGNVELAVDTLGPSAAAHEQLAQVKDSSLRAADLCQQLLAYSGRGRFVVKSFDLSEMVRDMTRLLEVSISKKVSLRFDLAGDLPAIEADVNQVRQIVMNLITNASEAIGEESGTISVWTGLARSSSDDSITRYCGVDDDDHVCLEVTDTGCGMDDETQSRIFDPFFTTKFTGRGLGLAAVLGIVRAHRAAIELQARPGQGASFRVLFPPSEQARESVAQPEKKADEWRGEGTILVVDDEESVRKLAKAILERRGFNVVSAGDGHEAVEVFRKLADEIDAVLLDLTMPGMSGLECLEELRRRDPDIKVLLSSGYNEHDVVGRFEAQGIAGFVQKPYRQVDFIAKIRELLRT